jgi:hypothetical protein
MVLDSGNISIIRIIILIITPLGLGAISKRLASRVSLFPWRPFVLLSPGLSLLGFNGHRASALPTCLLPILSHFFRLFNKKDD